MIVWTTLQKSFQITPASRHFSEVKSQWPNGSGYCTFCDKESSISVGKFRANRKSFINLRAMLALFKKIRKKGSAAEIWNINLADNTFDFDLASIPTIKANRWIRPLHVSLFR